MWKRIHSNRDPRDTLYSEIKKEFNPFFKSADQKGRQLLQNHPRLVFWIMVILIVTSSALSFTLFRTHEKAAPVTINNLTTVSDGLGKIMDATNRIKETLSLKKVVDSLSSRKHLDTRDSLLLDSALDRLQIIRKK